jgi:hypothetical protein
VRTAKREYPEVPRRRLARLHKRALSLRAANLARFELVWTEPGSVWAMDFKTPPAPVEGVYVGVLVVRDLASGMTLAATGTRTLLAREVAVVVQALFEEHGAPLVMKNDNGSNLIAEDVVSVLEEWRVLVLRSPPRCPSYNGACEAGVGSISRRAEEYAAWAGRPGRWTCDDLESARIQANREGRPRARRRGESPEEAWRARRRFGWEDRATLRAEALREYLAEWERRCEESDVTDRRVAASFERAAVSRALCNLHYLKIRRR